MRFPVVDKGKGAKKGVTGPKKESWILDVKPLEPKADTNVATNQPSTLKTVGLAPATLLYLLSFGKLDYFLWTVTKWLTSTNCFVYCSHFLSAWGDRMWQFAVALFLIQISPHSLQLTAIYGLTSGGAILIFAPLIGDWVDKRPRLFAARVTLLLQNLNVIICAVLVCLLVLFHDWAETFWQGWLITLWHAGIIVVAVFANLASLGNKLSVQRDWIVEICGRDKDRLATMGAVLRRIDLANKLLAPVATGQIMTFTSMLIGAIFIASWNFISMFVEYFLLWKVYKSVPALAGKKKRKSVVVEEVKESEANMKGETEETPMTNIPLSEDSQPEPHSTSKTTANEKTDGDDSEPGPETSITKPSNQEEAEDSIKGENSDMTGESPPTQTACCNKGGVCYKMFGGFIILYNGWKTYVQHKVARAGLGLACLYLTVLGFDNITTAYAYSQGLTESILGILMGSGALVGILGTFAFTRIRSRVGLERTGLFSFSAEIFCLILCLVSIWAPGSPFDPLNVNWGEKKTNISSPACHYGNTSDYYGMSSYRPAPVSSGNRDQLGFNQSDSRTLTAFDTNVTSPVICPVPTVQSYISIALLMTGIITARFGLWISDLTVTQIMLENVVETERGVVNGVQSSLNQLMDMLKFVLVVAAPHPELFGILIIISFAAVSTGGIFYASYSRKVRGHLFHPEKLKCGAITNGTHHPPVDVENGEVVTMAPAAV